MKTVTGDTEEAPTEKSQDTDSKTPRSGQPQFIYVTCLRGERRNGERIRL